MDDTDLKVMLTESYDRIAGLIKSIEMYHHAEREYFAYCGAEHDDECPEDDTCRCEHILPLDEADSFSARQIEMARRRLDRIREALDYLEQKENKMATWRAKMLEEAYQRELEDYEKIKDYPVVGLDPYKENK